MMVCCPETWGLLKLEANKPLLDGLLVGFAMIQMNQPLLKVASALKLIVRAGTGIDNIDIDAATA